MAAGTGAGTVLTPGSYLTVDWAALRIALSTLFLLRWTLGRTFNQRRTAAFSVGLGIGGVTRSRTVVPVSVRSVDTRLLRTSRRIWATNLDKLGTVDITATSAAASRGLCDLAGLPSNAQFAASKAW